MNKNWINENIKAIQKELKKKIIDRGYLLEKINKIKKEIIK
jgi:hypothetical protein